MKQSLADKLNPNWYSVSIINLLILGLIMLFYKELSEPVKTYLVPALVVFSLGNGLIGYCQGAYFRARGMKDSFREPIWFYCLAYVIWFALFLTYLFYRGVL